MEWRDKDLGRNYQLFQDERSTTPLGEVVLDPFMDHWTGESISNPFVYRCFTYREDAMRWVERGSKDESRIHNQQQACPSDQGDG